ncbi:MAG: putative peptidase [Syntrophaceae bacterium PtaU1.Bin231]|nr:MAG: putative peptidase [Syntrophaceae bacterium PtaU1.Bin231]
MEFDRTLADRRMGRLRSLLGVGAGEAVLILDLKNIQYLAGFTGSDGALFVAPDSAVLLVDGRYENQAKREAAGVEVRRYGDKLAGIAAVVSEGGQGRILFDAAAMTVEGHAKLTEKLPGVVLAPAPADLNRLRGVKEEWEIDRMRRAARIAGDAVLAVMDSIRPGVQEKDIAIELEYKMRRLGADGIAFPSIIASGENSAMPHASPGMRRIREHDVIVVDYGAVCEGYRSDETITLSVGKPPDEFREAYGAVREAHDTAMRAVRSGAVCGSVDAVARGLLSGKGWGPFFSHGTGHGVGLDVHEYPRLAAAVEGTLEAGMVVTVEPGIYLEGRWGIRIEDMVRVRNDDCEILTVFGKDPMVL